jgi:glycosyltransferase involved in cell wall biosynthesis
MKILFDYQIFCLQQYGGISRYFFELANYIAVNVESKVEIFTPLYINEYLSLNIGLRRKGIKIPCVSGVKRFGAWGISAALAYLMLRTRRDLDIFHETYYSQLDCCPHTAKRIITVFDMVQEKFLETSFARNKTRYAKAHAVKRADHVICISENTRRDLIEQLSVPEEKTSVVYLGYCLTAKEIMKPPVWDKPYILYVGKRGGYKNFAGLLRAYAKSLWLKEKFLLVCFGGGQFSTEERELMNTRGISPHNIIQISGGDAVLAGLYSTAAALVYPSLYEGFGIPPLEAMSFGCPVVCSRTSSLPEVVGSAAELFDPADEEEMCTAIERIISSTERSQLLVDRGYERIKQFSWEKCAQDTLDVYKKVLGN